MAAALITRVEPMDLNIMLRTISQGRNLTAQLLTPWTRPSQDPKLRDALGGGLSAPRRAPKTRATATSAGRHMQSCISASLHQCLFAGLRPLERVVPHVTCRDLILTVQFGQVLGCIQPARMWAFLQLGTFRVGAPRKKVACGGEDLGLGLHPCLQVRVRCFVWLFLPKRVISVPAPCRGR